MKKALTTLSILSLLFFGAFSAQAGIVIENTPSTDTVTQTQTGLTLTMSNVVKTSLGRVLELPISTADIRQGEVILATNAPCGRLYTTKEDGTEILNDASLIEENPDLSYLCLPLIEDLQADEELKDWDLAAKLKYINDQEESSK